MSSRKYVSGRIVELRKAIQEAEQLSMKPRLSSAEEQRVNVLLAKIKAFQNPALDEVKGGYSAETREFFNGLREERAVNMLAGVAGINYTEGTQGGSLVPIEFFDQVLHGMANFDPLLDEDVVTLDVTEKPFAGNPLQISGWDLSSIEAERVTEASQLVPIAVPNVAGDLLNGYSYRVPLSVTFELEQDGGDRLIGQLQEAYTVGFARGIGVDLVLGTGSSEPQGVLTGAANSGVTTGASGKLQLTDFTQIYFSVDRAYRNSPKCAWLMDDVMYQLVRQATDNSGRPLLNVIGDEELLLGKPVRVSPSMPSGSAAKSIVFGDLSHFVVHVSKLWVRRTIQTAIYVDAGKALWTALMRADAAVFDPTNGEKPPIVYATNHS